MAGEEVAVLSHHLDLGNPISNGGKALAICHIVDEEDPLGTAEIGSRDGSKSFLSSGIPDLEEDYGSREARGRETWSLILLPSRVMFFILKSMPIVVMNVGEKESFAYLRSKHVFPTPAA